MSCEVKKIADLADPVDVKKRLLGLHASELNHVPDNELPLQDVLISFSPAGDILALAWNTRVVILTSKWNSEEQGDVKTKFHILWDGEIEYKNKITSILCLPLIAQGKASAGTGVDWTCLAVGLDSGFIRFYTETGVLLVEEQLHNESILGIKCQSLSVRRYIGDAGSTEEIYVIYNSVICLLQGFPLFMTLKACRNHMARVKANCNDKSPVVSLVCKKLGFKNQDVTNDSEIIGMTPVNTFDHLMTASVCGGFNASYRSCAPQHSLVVATGKRPFIGFHYAFEGGSAPVLSDVAIAMASKVASAIGSAVPWFRGNSKGPAQEKPKGSVHDPAEAMMCRFALSDIFREGNSVLISPNKTLSVVTDALGRVMLIDNRQGIAIRMWKGYRDAQCGWIEVQEEKHCISQKERKNIIGRDSQGPLRNALFLVIYAPKKGLIDIWSIQHGSKITSFSASKNGRLLYTNYGLSGLNEVMLSCPNLAHYPCIFMDPLGGLKEIIVPFHFALSNENGDRARDSHLFKKLRNFLKEEEFDNEKLFNKIMNTCLDLKTDEVRLQVVEMLITNKYTTPDSLLAAIGCFSPDLDIKKEDLHPTTITLHQTISQLQKIVEFYQYLRVQYDLPPEYNTIAGNSVPNAKTLSSILLAPEREISRILQLSDTVKEIETQVVKSKTRVCFKDDGRCFYDFLSCFNFGISASVVLKDSLSLEKKSKISELMFQGWLYSNESIEKWREAAGKSDINPLGMMQVALFYWLHKKRGAPLEVELIRFMKLIRAICSLADVDEICVDYNEISSWWKEVRSILTNSSNPCHALTAALVCRAVGMGLENNSGLSISEGSIGKNGNEGEKTQNINESETGKTTVKGESNKNENEEKQAEGTPQKEISSSPEDESHSSLSEWENVSKDTCQFSLLIANLEDITILNAIVCQQPPSDHTTPFYTLPYEAKNISLKYILESGKGSVTETLAKWLSSAGVDPTLLIDTNDIEFSQMPHASQFLNDSGSLDEACAAELTEEDRGGLLSKSVEVGSEAKDDQTALCYILDKISLLKKHFPYSLTSSVLLANLTWEYIMFWYKNGTKLEALEAALAVLRQIPAKQMQHGVCSVLWTSHFKRRLEPIAKLMNTFGKLPKEELCVEVIGLSDIQLTKFLDLCNTFIEIYLDTEILAENPSLAKSEELWEGCPPAPKAIATLALTLPVACYQLVLLHFQLVIVLHMIARFNMKVAEPIQSLLGPIAKRYLFKEIFYKTEIVSYQDEEQNTFRLKFLYRVISASMELIHQEYRMTNNLISKEAIQCMGKCEKLALLWELNKDKLRIHQTCALYLNGFDHLAEEIMLTVNDREELGSKLLPIAGRKLIYYLSNAPNYLEGMAAMSPTLSTYLHSSLNWDCHKLISSNHSIQDTVALVKCMSRLIPKGHSDYQLSQMMLDSMFFFQRKT